jgi:polysaccharide biosynthesis/export protein
MRFSTVTTTLFFTASLAICLTNRLLAQTKQSKSRDETTYFQDNTDSLAAATTGPYVYRLQTGDVLAIAVSSLNAEADVVFNPYARAGISLSSGATMATSTDNNNLPIGYRISEAGAINFPKLGTLAVAGRSLSELETVLRDSLQRYLREPFVSTRLLNFKVSVLGEVNRPSVYTVQNERITLTEAISLAGDLTIFGKRENILVIRETAGKQEFARVNLTKRSLFRSAVYYLKPNDVIYVEPKSSKKAQASNTLPYVPSILGALTLVATVILNIIR